MKPFLSESCNGGDRDVGEGEREGRGGGVGMKDSKGRSERERERAGERQEVREGRRTKQAGLGHRSRDNRR